MVWSVRQRSTSSLDLSIRSARLVSGLILSAFVLTHLANLALGLVSLEAIDAWRTVLMAPWHSAAGSIFLALAAIVHAGIGLYTISKRRSLALSRVDVVQIILGVLTPPLLITHVLTLRATSIIVPDFDASYAVILSVYWSLAPTYAFQQLFVVVIVWVHAAIGFYSWIALRPIWPRIRTIVLPVLFLVPILALLGFAEAGKEILDRLENDPGWIDHVRASQRLYSQAAPTLDAINVSVVTGYWILVAAVLLSWAIRIYAGRSRRVRIIYDGEATASGKSGLSLLEISLSSGIPHAHICQGRGRCGTCRVEILRGGQNLTPRTDQEIKTLAHLHADDRTRLACQARLLQSDVSVARLLPAYADISAAQTPEEWGRKDSRPPTEETSPVPVVLPFEGAAP
ncbi:MAG TPA: 2Fe-2S iron-sulfur cluster-binding protein [Pararhizobium sp.]|uniref:2Fe-2S iron-sulfur cluster-binding protein n=1 Tax=Pararhizobium sp. TaxID=1977563 RepID=UPI002BA8F0E0|nr:2Fe-2S iron-sulfur cluster-binding protein [Pararhizobium sp.]HTO30686.1 2Fe-2S iron-sulfur cluster-binding protein [Pararhizobium sp.]